MSLHKEIKGIHVHKNLEPAYDGYFNYIYMNDGTSKRFVNIDMFRVAYEVGGGKIHVGHPERREVRSSVAHLECITLQGTRTTPVDELIEIVSHIFLVINKF